MTIYFSRTSQAAFFRYSLIAGLVLLITVSLFSKTACFTKANFYHCPLLDHLFTWYTFLGDGVVAMVLIIAAVVWNQRILATKLLLVFLFSGLIAQLLKRLFRAPRPKALLNEAFYDHFISGVTHSGFTSFPSGHTTTAFAVAAMLAFSCRGKTTGIFAFWIAMLVGYSRVYLGQHFVEDVLAGMVIGILSAVLIHHSCHSYLRKIKLLHPSPLYDRTAIGL